MKASDLISLLEYLRDAKMSTDLLTEMHHFSVKSRRVTFGAAISYFCRHDAMRTTNAQFAERCQFVVSRHRVGKGSLRKLVSEAMARYPLGVA